jgi:type I site-specific restriction endonuclease
VQDNLEEQLSAIECERENLEVQWNNIKKCVLDTMSDLIGKVDRKARKPIITQEMINKMDERRKWKNVNNKEGRKIYRRLRNILRAYVLRSWNFKDQDVTVKTKELGWKENHGIQNIGIEDSKGI